MHLLKAAILAGAATWGAPTVPDVPDRPPVREGACEATVYGTGSKWHGDYTADGARFRPREEITVAHKSIPLGTTIYVESTTTGETIAAPVTDRGPYTVETVDGRTKAVGPAYDPGPGEAWNRCLDLSIAAAEELGGFRIHEVRLRYWRVRPAPVGVFAASSP